MLTCGHYNDLKEWLKVTLKWRKRSLLTQILVLIILSAVIVQTILMGTIMTHFSSLQDNPTPSVEEMSKRIVNGTRNAYMDHAES